MKYYLTLACMAWLCIPFLSSAQNNTLDFDGINDFVSVPDNNSLDITGSITIEAWIKPDLTGPEKTILIKGTSNQCMNYGLVMKDGNLAYLSGGQCGWAGKGPNAILQTGVWQHVAAVASGTNLKLYVNGVLTDNITLTSAIGPVNTQPLWIGNSTAGFINYADTQLDEIRIWNVVRTQAEISANMNDEISCSSTGLVAYYKFNQGTGGANNSGITTLLDCTFNNNNGTLSNFSLNGSSSNWLGSSSSLPLDLLSFEATAYRDHVDLEWTSNNELNVRGYEIQTSQDALHWNPIHFVTAINNKNTSQYTHQNIASGLGKHYYRLKMYDHDDSYKFSHIIGVELHTTEAVYVYPNPTTNIINIKGTSSGILRIRDNVGRILRETILTEAPIDLQDLPAGVYEVQIYFKNQVVNQVLIKN